MRDDIADSSVRPDTSGSMVTRCRFLRRAGVTVGGVAAAGGLLASGTMAIAGQTLAAGALSTNARATLPSDTAVARQAAALLADAAWRQLFRGSVLIARHGEILLSKGYDWADVASRVPNTASTRFRIASITKQFTAMAILQLQEQGKLRVHDHVSAYLPNTPAAWHAITLHHLLTHTSGIPDYTTLPNFDAASTETLTPLQAIDLFRDQPLEFPPGTRWKYDNSGYQVLGYLVTLLSGLSYPRFLRRHIFTPLRMADSGYDANHPALPLHATGYATWTEPAGYIDMSVVFADGSLYATVGDLYRWDREVTSAHPTIVSRDSLRQMFTPWVPTDSSRALYYGYGWFIGTEGGHRFIDHTGDLNGFISDNGFFPDDEATLIVLSNFEASSGLRQITGHLSGILFGLGDCVEMVMPCVEM
jgi:CubicO group peptidase (beta-lactamase class C family)